MNRKVMDLWVGVFVAIGFAAILFLALKVSNFSASGLASTYEITARFDNIGGLKVRGPVKSAGVVVFNADWFYTGGGRAGCACT